MAFVRWRILICYFNRITFSPFISVLPMWCFFLIHLRAGHLHLLLQWPSGLLDCSDQPAKLFSPLSPHPALPISYSFKEDDLPRQMRPCLCHNNVLPPQSYRLTTRMCVHGHARAHTHTALYVSSQVLSQCILSLGIIFLIKDGSHHESWLHYRMTELCLSFTKLWYACLPSDVLFRLRGVLTRAFALGSDRARCSNHRSILYLAQGYPCYPRQINVSESQILPQDVPLRTVGKDLWLTNVMYLAQCPAPTSSNHLGPHLYKNVQYGEISRGRHTNGIEFRYSLPFIMTTTRIGEGIYSIYERSNYWGYLSNTDCSPPAKWLWKCSVFLKKSLCKVMLWHLSTYILLNIHVRMHF